MQWYSLHSGSGLTPHRDVTKLEMQRNPTLLVHAVLGCQPSTWSRHRARKLHQVSPLSPRITAPPNKQVLKRSDLKKEKKKKSNLLAVTGKKGTGITYQRTGK